MKTHKIRTALLFFIISIVFLIPTKAFAVETNNVQTVSKDTIWSIDFNEALLLDEVSKENIYILDENGETVEISLELINEEKTLLINPPTQGYEAGKTYLLKITEKVHNAAGENLMQPVNFQFIIETPVYIIKANNINLSIKQGQAYTLQKKVTVDYSNGERRDRDVIWSPATIDTTKAGIYTFKGTVEGYDTKIDLTLNVTFDHDYLVKPSIVMAELSWDSYFYDDKSLNAKKLGIVKKGDKVEIIKDKGYLWYYVKTKEGSYGWIKGNTLIIPKDFITNATKLTKEEAEGYVNFKKFDSTTKYFIWVDISRQTVNVFQGTSEKYKLIKTMSCATGRNASPTTRGTFTIQNRGTWFFKGASGAKNWVQFNGDYLFHSIIMNEDQNVKDYTLGRQASAGCIRLSIDDSKWMYDNMTSGTTVWIN